MRAVYQTARHWASLLKLFFKYIHIQGLIKEELTPYAHSKLLLRYIALTMATECARPKLWLSPNEQHTVFSMHTMPQERKQYQLPMQAWKHPLAQMFNLNLRRCTGLTKLEATLSTSWQMLAKAGCGDAFIKEGGNQDLEVVVKSHQKFQASAFR